MKEFSGQLNFRSHSPLKCKELPSRFPTFPSGEILDTFILVLTSHLASDTALYPFQTLLFFLSPNTLLSMFSLHSRAKPYDLHPTRLFRKTNPSHDSLFFTSFLNSSLSLYLYSSLFAALASSSFSSMSTPFYSSHTQQRITRLPFSASSVRIFFKFFFLCLS